jgi:Protein of unknown function (DUF1761)
MPQKDHPMQFAGINYVAILVAAAAAWVLAAVWYGALARISSARSRGGAAFLIAVVADLVIAWILAGLMGHLGARQFTPLRGAITGAFCWFGFVMPTLIVNNRFGRRAALLILLDGGYWLVTLLAIGAILGGIGLG